MDSPATRLYRNRVFLSHAGVDTQAAHHFAEMLRRNGVDVWFDKDNLQPGDRWMATLEDAIEQSSAMLVYVGQLGAGMGRSRSWLRPGAQHRCPGCVQAHSCTW